MTGFFDWLFAFIAKMLAVPELGALLPAIGVGLAIAYLSTLPLPLRTPARVVQHYAALLIVFVVTGISTWMLPTPRMAMWAFTVSVFIPKTYEWASAAIYHRWPWLKPKALMTNSELVQRELDKAADQ